MRLTSLRVVYVFMYSEESSQRAVNLYSTEETISRVAAEENYGRDTHPITSCPHEPRPVLPVRASS